VGESNPQPSTVIPDHSSFYFFATYILGDNVTSTLHARATPANVHKKASAFIFRYIIASKNKLKVKESSPNVTTKLKVRTTFRVTLFR
jgi:hypothetical protein